MFTPDTPPKPVPQPALLPYTTLSQREFDLYSGYWKVVVNLGMPNLLNDCFLNGKAIHAGYSADQIGLLVSTVGAHTIEARFVCGVSSLIPSQLASFGVVLYAADRCGNRLSSYYLAAGTDHIPSPSEGTAPATPNNGDLPQTMSAGDGQGAVQVPHYLAASWINNWKCIWDKDNNDKCKDYPGKGEKAKPDMFITAAGTLQGYSFNLGDLSQSLFNAQSKTGLFYMLFNFGLHEYYALDSPDKPGYTFGLVIRLYDADGTPTPKQPGSTIRYSRGATSVATGLSGSKDGDDGVSNEPFYDMSAPRPPY